MRLFRLRSARVCFAACASLAVAAEWRLPPLSGDLSGKFLLTDGSGTPEIAWRVQAAASDAATPRAELNASAPGLAVRVALTPPGERTPGSWTLLDATIELAEWWRLAAARAGVAVKPADLRLGGTLRVTGEGTWDGPVWRGALHVTLADATAASDEQGWSAGEIGLTADLTLAENSAALRTAELRIGRAQMAAIVVRQAILEFAGGERGRIEVRRAQLDVFGGRLALAPFTLDPAAPAVRTAAEFSGIALGELAALVPQALAEARGQVAGKVAVNWSLKSGVQPDAGGLEISPGGPATFRLAKSPGLLTGRAPPKIAFLPAWTGPLSKWFSADNPAYDSLRRIELGEVPLTMENLRVQLFPDGPGGARTAHVEVAARPTAGSAVERVTFSINLSGPLTQVLKLGMDDRAKVRMAPSR
jgi:hypothetical protein